jgi:cell wall-associated NlpC family hydrolase
MVNGRKLATEAIKFLGVPYLWGGISPLGFDCSGLVQTICARFGIAVPRDTDKQIRIGKQVQDMETRVGDLLFFKRHVGFALGQKRIIHASLGGGGVRINSLVPGAPDYRSDLDREFQQARRIV